MSLPLQARNARDSSFEEWNDRNREGSCVAVRTSNRLYHYTEQDITRVGITGLGAHSLLCIKGQLLCATTCQH